MFDWLTTAACVAALILLTVVCLRQDRRYRRHAVNAARERADLHRQLATANTELATAAFADGHDEVAKTRLEMADIHTEASEALTRHAHEEESADASLRARWKRRGATH